MNHRSKPDLNNKGKYQSYYIKKLQTQSSVEKLNEKTLSQTTEILEKQIQKMEKSLYKKNSLYASALKRKSQIQQRQQKTRSQLRSKIQQKMRKSQQNLLSFRQKSVSSLSSRLKAQAQKIQEIKTLKKTFYNHSYQKSKQMSTKTQRFFQGLSEKKIIKEKNIPFDKSQGKKITKKQPIFYPLSYNKTKRQKNKQLSFDSKSPNPQRRQSFLVKIKSQRQSIDKKQKKKSELQNAKEDSFLQQYAKKLQTIEAARKKIQNQKKVPQCTISKFVKRQIFDEDNQQKRRFSKSFVNQAVSSKGLFSEIYQKKLKQKREKISFFLSQSIAEGDMIMKNEFEQKSKLKINKLIRQTQNELARKQNFRYMQKYLNKKF